MIQSTNSNNESSSFQKPQCTNLDLHPLIHHCPEATWSRSRSDWLSERPEITYSRTNEARHTQRLCTFPRAALPSSFQTRFLLRWEASRTFASRRSLAFFDTAKRYCMGWCFSSTRASVHWELDWQGWNGWVCLFYHFTTLRARHLKARIHHCTVSKSVKAQIWNLHTWAKIGRIWN